VGLARTAEEAEACEQGAIVNLRRRKTVVPSAREQRDEWLDWMLLGQNNTNRREN
jgi:hypothetical protein